MRHLLAAGNLGLVVPRQSKEEPGALVTDTLIAHKTVSAFDINSVFPLYLHADPEAPRLDGAGRAANLAPAFLARLAGLLGEEPSPRSWSSSTSTPSSTRPPTGGATRTSCGRTSRASRCRRSAAPSWSWRGSARC